LVTSFQGTLEAWYSSVLKTAIVGSPVSKVKLTNDLDISVLLEYNVDIKLEREVKGWND